MQKHTLSEIEHDPYAHSYVAFCEECYDPDYEDGSYTGYHLYIEATPQDVRNAHYEHIEDMCIDEIGDN